MRGVSTWSAAALVIVALTAIVGVAAATVAISRTPDSVSATERERSTGFIPADVTSVTVAPGDTAAVIGRRLVASGAIASAFRFELLASLVGWESGLEAGSYTFESGITTYEILRRIHFGETSPLRVVIPEGLRVEQVTQRLVQAQVVEAAAFTAELASEAAGRSGALLAAQRPAGASLEGYLAPGSYSFPLGASAEDVLEIMLKRFDESLSPRLRDLIERSGFTLHEILTVASIIEREVVEDSERAVVSAVIRNRLEVGMPLQMDPTVQYAVGEFGDWWKRELTVEDLATESPYNTYVVSGLPPTPIASPGVASIEAAASPANVPYLFFVARGDGTHAFAVTYEEHQANVERYQGGSQ